MITLFLFCENEIAFDNRTKAVLCSEGIEAKHKVKYLPVNSMETLYKVFEKLSLGFAGKIVRNAIKPPKIISTIMFDNLVVI